MKALQMRLLAILLVFTAAAPAAAQAPLPGAPVGILDALRRDFPLDYNALARELAGKAPDEARRLAYAAIDRFLRAHSSAILAAPASSLVALEARQGALLRALGKQDVRLCALLGDRGFFGEDALAGPSPPGFDAFGAALIEAAKAGAGPARAAPAPAGPEDFAAWFAMVEKIEPDIPVRAMLGDRALRTASPPDKLCRGAAAMHEAAAALPGGAGERMSRTLLRLSIGAAGD
ncbi:MAG TPA: hypothetical protein VFZ91_10525 [Allosphingosinicella sp.]